MTDQDRVEQIERGLLDDARCDYRDEELAVVCALGAACRWIAKLEARVADREPDAIAFHMLRKRLCEILANNLDSPEALSNAVSNAIDEQDARIAELEQQIEDLEVERDTLRAGGEE